MPRSLGKYTIAFDQRTGFKVKYKDLVEDGEHPHLLVEKGTEDPEHPQKYVRLPGPDQIALFRPAPPNDTNHITLTLGWGPASSNLADGFETVPVTQCNTASQAEMTYGVPYGYGAGGYGAGGYGGTPETRTTETVTC